jgi:hypothetical protein
MQVKAGATAARTTITRSVGAPCPTMRQPTGRAGHHGPGGSGQRHDGWEATDVDPRGIRSACPGAECLEELVLAHAGPAVDAPPRGQILELVDVEIHQVPVCVTVGRALGVRHSPPVLSVVGHAGLSFPPGRSVVFSVEIRGDVDDPAEPAAVEASRDPVYPTSRGRLCRRLCPCNVIPPVADDSGFASNVIDL